MDYGIDYYYDGGYGGGDYNDIGWVYIKSSMHGKVLDVSGNNMNPGADVVMYDQKSPEESANQLFYYDDSTQTIRSRLNDFCLDLNSGRRISIDTFTCLCYGIYLSTSYAHFISHLLGVVFYLIPRLFFCAICSETNSDADYYSTLILDITKKNLQPFYLMPD